MSSTIKVNVHKLSVTWFTRKRASSMAHVLKGVVEWMIFDNYIQWGL